MSRLQKLSKRKLDIDLSKLQVSMVWDEDEDKYLAERKRLEKAVKDAAANLYKAESDLLDFYILYGVRNVIDEKEALNK